MRSHLEEWMDSEEREAFLRWHQSTHGFPWEQQQQHYSTYDDLHGSSWNDTGNYDSYFEDDEGLSSMGHAMRWLQKKGSGARMDYSVLSVTVMTLGLILAVEVIRHRIDHAAVGRPYVVAVLENIYAELTTLGIVEFFVFLIQEYHVNLNNDKKEVFAAVHFALFYTAILNAFQSVVLAAASTNISHKMWVQTEALELNHYVEIREEFDRVQEEIRRTKGELRLGKSDSASADESTSTEGPNHKEEEANKLSLRSNHIERISTGDNQSVDDEYVFDYTFGGLRALIQGAIYRLRYPRLERRYHDLLVQVRFHDLRVHFLHAYDLPSRVKVSDYLVRCELQVLIKLVHVSSFSWLLLTGAANLLYYILGIVGYKTQDPEVVGTTLIDMFFVCMGIFVVLAVVLENKVKKVFSEVMHAPDLWEAVEDEEEQVELAKKQMNFFWFGSPKLVITLIQFMQFGYAVALSVVIMFWEEINDADIPMGYYLLTVVVCYLLFVRVAAEVIPRYTLCTSLGQLVDKKRLHETVSSFQLEEEKRKRQEAEIVREYMRKENALAAKREGRKTKTSSKIDAADALALMALEPEPIEQTPLVLEGDSAKTVNGSMRNMSREERKARRRRQRAISDGVALMAGMTKRTEDFNIDKRMIVISDGTELPGNSLDMQDGNGSKPSERLDSELVAGGRGRRKKSKSDEVHRMVEMEDAASNASVSTSDVDHSRIADLVKMDTQALRSKLTRDDVEKLENRKTAAEESLPIGRGKLVRAVSRRMKSSSADGDPFPSARKGTTGSVVDVSTNNKESTNGEAKGISGDATKYSDDISEGDESDDDDVPDVNPLFIKQMTVEVSESKSFKEKCQDYYASKRYVVVSNVFGTMVAFFAVGSRVERFLHTEDIVPRNYISFDFEERVTFWGLSCWLCFFLMNDLMIFWCVDGDSVARKYRVIWFASIIDLVIVVGCWVALWVAESKRCCEDADMVAVPEPLGFGPAPCSCPPFGSRLYGGLGAIEPYVSLLCLRIFRFFAAKRIVKFINWKHGLRPTFDERKLDLESERNLNPFKMRRSVRAESGRGDEHGHGHGHSERGHGGHGHDDDHGHGHGPAKGTAAEIWQDAIGKHPDIVEKYGPFSAEVLQVMLGIPIVESLESEKTPKAGKGKSEHPETEEHKSYTIDQKYSNLDTKAQEIIMAGKLGHGVRSTSLGIGRAATFGARGRSSTFEIADDVVTIPRGLDDEQTILDAPNARLVRSMRRCDRKLLPILDKWTVVDVVMTRFEMVYFDAVDLGNESASASCREALVATKGGKGLRICDVAAGRRIVGHLRFSDVHSIHVERRKPGHVVPEERGPDEDVAASEYWKQAPKLSFARRDLWPKMEQDCLKVQTTEGSTLYLRFYADLDDAEHKKEKDETTVFGEDDGHHHKNNAFQWVQTIGRFIGPEQLHQHLPHFGSCNELELRDYLEFAEETEQAHRMGHFSHQLRRLLKRSTSHGGEDHSESYGAPASERFELPPMPKLEKPQRAHSDGEVKKASNKPHDPSDVV